MHWTNAEPGMMDAERELILIDQTPGEIVFLSAADTDLACVAEASAEGKILIAGLAAESVHEAVRVANRAAEMGYHVALALTPFYFKNQMHRPATQALFFQALADQSKLPVLLYNIPGVTGYDLPVETIAALSEHPNIVGMKDSSGNLEKLAATAKAASFGLLVSAT